MTTAADRGWGDPGPPGSTAGKQYRLEHIVGIDAGGARLYVRRELAHIFKGFVDEIVEKGYKIDGHADDWGFAHRPIRGYENRYAASKDPRWLSNHSWGLAVDLNATDHPLGKRGTGVPQYVVEAARRWGLFWGGNYSGRPDEMHFEFLGRPEDVARFPLQEELTMDDEARKAFAAVDGRLDVLEDQLSKALDALAGWQPGRKQRSLIGRIGDHLHITR